MYPDYFYNFLETNVWGWIFIALSYGIFFYIFNTLACLFFGGIDKISHFKQLIKKFKTKKSKRTSKYIKVFLKQYKQGAKQRLKEFQSDRLSWLWPATILAIPVGLYGYSHIVIEDAILSLNQIDIKFSSYQILPIKNNLQFFLWGIAFIVGSSSFFRYQFQSSKKNWFSKSITHNFIQTLLINIPLTFIVVSLLFIWINFSLNLGQILIDNSLTYPVFHPDLIYGLDTIYKTIFSLLIIIIIGSFLPTIMIIREKNEKYSKIYYAFIYSGIILLFVSIGSLIYLFHMRVGAINQQKLMEIYLALEKTDILNQVVDTNVAIMNLYYFSLVSNLPNKFPIPEWVKLLMSIRTVALIYELVKLSTPNMKENLFIKTLEAIIKNG